MTREEAEKISAELVAKGMAEADAYIAATRAMLATLKMVHEASRQEINSPRRQEIMDIAMTLVRAAIAQAEAAGIKEEI